MRFRGLPPRRLWSQGVQAWFGPPTCKLARCAVGRSRFGLWFWFQAGLGLVPGWASACYFFAARTLALGLVEGSVGGFHNCVRLDWLRVWDWARPWAGFMGFGTLGFSTGLRTDLGCRAGLELASRGEYGLFEVQGLGFLGFPCVCVCVSLSLSLSFSRHVHLDACDYSGTGVAR